MQSLDDPALLRLYIDHESDEAFAELVKRHLNLVYSVAIRQLGDTHQAEEVAQAVFIILSKKAGQLRSEKALSSWLFQTTRFTANNFIRSEMRRHHREHEAHMRSVLDESEDDVWQQIAPLLDAAVGQLSEKDQHAIVLRFYEGRSFREVGAGLGASEDAAEKRVSRSLERLRGYFKKRGVALSAGVLATAITANSVQAAPAALAISVAAGAAKGAAVSGSTLTLIKGALKIMAWTKAKTSVVIGACVLLAAGTTFIIVKTIESHGTVTIRAHIDGIEVMNLHGHQLWLEHVDFQLPENPIFVNGKGWLPTWNENVSTRYMGLNRGLNTSHPENIKITTRAGRGSVSIKELPSPANDETLAVLIDDGLYGGADWYEFTVSW